ncbi:MAG: PAS domain S-box protein [Oryzomonas sp.]|uniref:PAS domain S-box protein n=1 Tax=Oryzomonas sp. TaxID=2855186 RepID=UPI00283B4D67|nr:PAS domain S-box protein [Oryzomonas sp.]MDR3580698.1 PAS domain S-box protein [Oryzomonas sp.]
MDNEHHGHGEYDMFRTILASSVDGFTLANATGYIIDVNESYSQMLGYTRDQLLTMHMSDVEAIDSAGDVAKRSQEIMQKGSLRFDTKQLHKNGNAIDVEVSVNYSPHNGGSFFSIVRDITKRKQAEEALQKSEEKFTKVFKVSPEAMVITSMVDGRYLDVNDAFLEITGLQRDEVIGHTSLELGFWLDASERQQFFEKLTNNGFLKNHEFRYRVKNEIRYFWVSSELLDIDGTRCSLCFIKDITERKLTEQKYKETSDYLHGLFAAIHDGITVFDPNGVHVEVNDAFCAMTGYSKEELLGSGLPHIYWPEEQIATHIAAFGDMSINKFMERELIFKRKNGERFPVILYPSEMKDKSGQIIRYLATVKDVSDRQKAEKALQQSEERYRRFTGLTSDFVYMCSRSSTTPFRIQWLGGAFEAITGYSQDELIDIGCWLTLVVDDDRERIARSLIELRPGDHVISEFRILTKRGDIRWLKESCRCEAGEEPDYLLLYGSSQDITAEKISEMALKKSEYFFKESQRSASIGSYFADFISGKWETSEVLDTIFGIDENYNRSIQGWLDIVHPDDRDYMSRYLMEDVISNRKPFSMEYRIIRKNDGEKRWVNGRGSVEFDSNGNILSLIGTVQDITERKEIEEALSHSELFLKTIIDLEPECIKMLDIDGNLLMMNPAGLEMIQAESFEQVKGYCFYPFVAEPNRADFIALTQSVFQGVPGTLEFETVGLKGRHIWLETHAVPFRDEQGVIKALLGVTRDTTERKQANETLRKSEEQFWNAMEATQDGLWDWDIPSGKVYYSPGYFRMLGYEPDELPHELETWTRLIHPDDKDRTITVNEQCINNEIDSFKVEFRMLAKNGDWRWILGRGKAIKRSPDGKAIHMIGTHVDITDQKNAEEAIYASESHYRSLFENSITGVLAVDRDFIITNVNGAFCNLLGYAKDELIGRMSISEITYPDDVEKSIDIFKMLVRGEIDHYSLEKSYVSKSGEKVVALIYVKGIYSQDGCFEGSIGSVLDITNRKRAEEALKKLNNELENRVAERTEELLANLERLKIETEERIQTTETLREKEQMLIQQSRLAAMGEMIGNIAHQWRQPLNTLGLTIQQLSMFHDLGEFTKELLDNSVNRSMEIIQHMSQTIEDFRNYFKPDKIKIEFNMQNAIKSTLALIEDSFKSQHIDVELVTTGEPVIHGYRNEFAQVVLNILNNARDVLVERAIKDPRVTITIGSENERAVVTISDNAGGIPEEIIGKIFDPYFTTKGPQLGTGVGLFMSKTIIEKNMNGSLTVRNTVDGAEFRIEV